jgi:integral membrane sensor domain MASE1
LTVAILYAAVGKLGQMATTLPGNISPIFPSAGIALAAVLVLGWPAWIGVWLGSLVLNVGFAIVRERSLLAQIVHLPLGCLIALGAAASAGVGAHLVRRLCKEDHPLASGRNALILVAIGAVGAGAVSALTRMGPRFLRSIPPEGSVA